MQLFIWQDFEPNAGVEPAFPVHKTGFIPNSLAVMALTVVDVNRSWTSIVRSEVTAQSLADPIGTRIIGAPVILFSYYMWKGTGGAGYFASGCHP